MKTRKIIDLTLPISPESPAPARMPRPSFELVRTMEIDRCRTSLITLYNHAGTHVDSPRHFLTDGKGVDAIDLQQCIGPAWVVDVAHLKSGSRITISDLGEFEEHIQCGDRILLRTGWDRFYPEEAYYQEFPAVSVDLAAWLVEREVALIGIDTGSIAATGNWDELVAVHHQLLSTGIVLVEGLTHLDQLPMGKKVDFILLPLKLDGLDGSPARAIAILP